MTPVLPFVCGACVATLAWIPINLVMARQLRESTQLLTRSTEALRNLTEAAACRDEAYTDLLAQKDATIAMLRRQLGAPAAPAPKLPPFPGFNDEGIKQ